jgi:hypothetical protein
MYKMPIYSCECCNYSTAIKTQYERHMATTKHLNNIKKQPAEEEDKLTSKDIAESIEMLFEEIAFLKKDKAELKKENAEMKAALQECKQLIMDMKTYVPTYVPQPPSPQPPPPQPQPQPQPQPIIIQTNQPPPTEKKETCNPTYHCNDLNEDEKLKSIQGVDTYFKIAGDVQFEFNDLQEEDDIRVINKAWVLKKLTNFVSENKEHIPFRYYKGSLYFKNEEGSWEREIRPVNKGEKLSNGTYNHSLLVKKLIFIIRNRTIMHLDNLLGDQWRLRNVDDLFVNMEKETFNRDVWRNAELAAKLQHLLM